LNENVSEEDGNMDETKFKKIRKYDSSQFSNKMSQIDRKPKVKQQLAPLREQQPLLDVNQSDIMVEVEDPRSKIPKYLSQSQKHDPLTTPQINTQKKSMALVNDIKLSHTPQIQAQ